MNVIFDLDGTLIDSRLRLYRLFQKLVPDSKLTFEAYWEFKRNKISNEIILAKEFGFDVGRIDRFIIDWMDKIETPEFLALDQNFPFMHETLQRLQRQATLYVCTARQVRHSAVDQLNRLSLLNYFTDIMVTEQRKSKMDLIRYISNLGPQDWIIGDTGLDIKVGRDLGMKTCAVLSGFLNEKKLRDYAPDLILPNAADFYL